MEETTKDALVRFRNGIKSKVTLQKYERKLKMSYYQTIYPSKIQLDDNQVIDLTFDDNKNRSLITEVEIGEKALRQGFTTHAFEEVLVMEEVKKDQIGNGMRKHLNKDWDMHVRFLHLHDGFIAIDAEVETNMEYVEHVTKNNWISVLNEVWEIVTEITKKIWIFHKTSGHYVKQVLNYMNIKMNPFKDQTEWKPVVAVVGILALLGLVLYYSKK